MSDKPQIINPPNRLKSKVRMGGPGAVNASVLSRAEQVVQDMSGAFLEWVVSDLAAMQDALDSLRGGSDAELELDRIYRKAHDIKGQGGSFGYDLMTEIGTLLTRYVKTLDQPTAKEMDLIQICVDSMRLVIDQRLAGHGGAEGKAILGGLSAVVERLSDRTTDTPQ